MEHNNNLNYLLQGHIEGRLSDEEKLQLMQFLDNPDNRKQYSEAISMFYEKSGSDTSLYREEEVERMIRYILAAAATPAAITTALPRRHILRTTWFKYAAAIIIIFGIGTYSLYMQKREAPVTAQHHPVPAQNDVLPGSDRAILTLSNGQNVALNPTGQRTITDGELAISNKDGMLTYGKSREVLYNTMSTPKGAQYRVTLADGTNVWLNAASSINYPTSFPGKERVVSITGEVYFEVAKNPLKPFIVKTSKEEITVLGTHFNVNAYPDEPGIKTSLEEGLVRIDNQTLTPGYAYMNGKLLLTSLDQDLAWKNRLFDFNQCSLQVVMRQIARWYDVDVIYEKNIPSMQFYGKMGRDLKLSQVLSILEKSDVHFKIDGKKLIVHP